MQRDTHLARRRVHRRGRPRDGHRTPKAKQQSWTESRPLHRGLLSRRRAQGRHDGPESPAVQEPRPCRSPPGDLRLTNAPVRTTSSFHPRRRSSSSSRLSLDRPLVRQRVAEQRVGMAATAAFDQSRGLGCAAVAHLSRYRGTSREHTESDLRVFSTWRQARQRAPLTAQRHNLRLSLPCLQDVRRFKPTTVSRRLSDRAAPARTDAGYGWAGTWPPADFVNSRRSDAPAHASTHVRDHDAGGWGRPAGRADRRDFEQQTFDAECGGRAKYQGGTCNDVLRTSES